MKKKKNREIRYYYIKKNEHYSEEEMRSARKCMSAVKAAREGLGNDIYEEVGGEVLGPILTGYAIWLRGILLHEHVDELIFLSREGEALKHVYDTLYDADKDVREEYIHISRISMIRSCIKLTTSSEQFMLLLSGLLNHIKTVEEVCKLLGLSDEIIMELNHKYSIDEKTNIHLLGDYSYFYNALLDVGDDVFTSEHDNAVAYFRQKGITDGKRILISDIGWAGTMQYFLRLMFPYVEFIGAYLAVNSFHSSIGYTSLQRYGYVCNSDSWNSYGLELRFTTLVIECLLQNSEGTTLGYVKDKHEIRALMQDRKDVDRIKNAVNGLREGYITFAKAYKYLSINGQYDEILPSASLIGYRHFAVYPRMSTVFFFNRYRNVSEGIDSNITCAHSLLYYIIHPREFYREFDISNAKVIWLKSVFKLPINYFKLLTFLTMKVDMKSRRQQFIEGA